MNVLLIKPWGDSFNWYHSHMLGLAYLAGYLRKHGHNVGIIDAAFMRMTKENLLQKISSFRPDVVGVTAMTHEVPRAREIFTALKKQDANIFTIIGGPHASARPQETVEESGDCDAAISGEGEFSFVKLLDALEHGKKSFEGIPGLAFRQNNTVLYNGPQTSYVDLITIPQPAVDLYYSKGWFNAHPQSEYRLFASRGCPFRCAYCLRVLGGKVRWREPEDVIEEWIKAVRYYGAKNIFLHDEIFLYDNPHTHAILDGILKAGIHKEAHFDAMTHITLIDKAILQKAARANCRKVCIGVESGNNEILKNSNRPYTIADAKVAVKAIKKAGIRPFTFFILGHPGETHKTVRDTLRAAIRLNPFEIGLGIMVPYPGTKIYELAKNNEGGYKLTGADWDAYDRYGGRAMEFDNFKRSQLIMYQVVGYVLFFVLNGKFIGLYRYFRPKLKAVWRVITGKGL